jgi:hypothetical protein
MARRISPHPEFDRKQPEVFAEYIDPYRVDEVDGGQRREEWHALYRLQALPLASDARKCGVRKHLIATVHARIIAHEKGRDGQDLAVVAGRGRWGNSFLFQCPFHWLTSGKSGDVRRFVSLLHNRAGAGTFVIPGKATALCRAIVQLSEEGTPMLRPLEWEPRPVKRGPVGQWIAPKRPGGRHG